ncbi:MAG: SAM-dependent methyltransferase, partial [Lachnospiraceae bacterium]|nr:SAM-dependent methyltransferase [Lachnospiraceae bacterium]
FFLVHRPERLAELIDTLRENKLEPKRLRMVHSFPNSQATMVLIEAAKGGNTFLKVEPPLIIYKSQGIYTDEILDIYNF